MPQPEYIQERLQQLESIDLTLCKMLQEASQVVFTFSELKRGNYQLKPQFQAHIQTFYSDLDSVNENLRNEIKHLDENIGTRLLPINNVNKKAIGLDDDKLLEQIELLKNVLNVDENIDIDVDMDASKE
ncbi:Med11p NDAI_0J00190 [Naumovozyma dairenensis CBS 421]|uniref:Mediator of RNA polymerase II transcription subunit 11 n=1 Tax=Naumovozyma dairenensis (strain ATCC 10597 / BCRC 20456 / CBS 421 / NBRC 0211 / NRRL Y-12639) TaxID=1071378 RepID=G0WHD1_NAUDC|nr:hypothetical protein NDAI_0J00190 [Naumovozyma dairenensis CBS 421]CCD26911.1 hypothetical protein NDAI_0J00190 [Naumovozyma dairenensis CBS 421]